MKINSTVFFALILTKIAVANPPKNIVSDGLFERVEIGIIQRDKETWHILRGRECRDCDANISLWLVKHIHLGTPEEFTSIKMAFPGEYKDYETKKPINRSRAFWGACLDNNPSTIIWVGESFNNGKSSQFTEYLVSTKSKPFVKPKMPSLSKTDIKKLETKKTCKEITGIDQLSEP